jgi:hypothetical protein
MWELLDFEEPQIREALTFSYLMAESLNRWEYKILSHS